MNVSHVLLELSDYFDYIKNHNVFFTIVLVCHNHDNYSGFKRLHELLKFLSIKFPKGIE